MHEKLIAELEEFAGPLKNNHSEDIKSDVRLLYQAAAALREDAKELTYLRGELNKRPISNFAKPLREARDEVTDLRAKLKKAEALSINNVPFYRLSIHRLRDSINRLLWAYKHSEECERAKEENKTSFQPTCTCIDSDAIEYGAQTLFNTEQVAKAIEAISALKEGK